MVTNWTRSATPCRTAFARDSKRGGRHVGGYNHAVRTFVCQRYRDAAAAGPDVCNLNWPGKWLPAFTAAEKA